MDGSSFDQLSRRVARFGTRRQALRAIVGAVAASVAGVRAAEAQSCTAQYRPCQSDGQCCAGAVCQSGMCQPGCRIDGVFRSASTPQPGNTCARCAPAVSTTSWSAVNEGMTCAGGGGSLCGSGPSNCRSGVCTPSASITCQPLTVCHVAGACNPSTGLCSHPPAPAGTPCGTGEQCIGGFHSPGLTCNGAGSCTGGQTRPCAPYVCSGSSCRTDCTTDSHCSTGAVCRAGGCLYPRALGESCSVDHECGSGHCVAEICCNEACESRCSTCPTGTCRPVVCNDGRSCTDDACNPDTGECVFTPRAGFCLIDGACVTAGAYRPGVPCELCDPARNAYGWSVAPAGAVCRGEPDACRDGVITTSWCDGASATGCTESTDFCAPYGCAAGGGVACAIVCTDDSDCLSGARCAGGECRVPVGQGAACLGDAHCQSGYCVESICCDIACESRCDTCETGTCLPINCADSLDCTTDSCDPDNGQCLNMLDAGYCLIDGETCVVAGTYRPGAPCALCDPARDAYDWSIAPVDAVCGGVPDLCQDGVASWSSCNGTEAEGCSQGSTPCAPYGCAGDGVICAASCTTDDQCAPGVRCAGGECRVPVGQGAACLGDAHCQSGHCVESICCDTACESQCDTCETGTCLPLPITCAGEHDCEIGSCDPDTGECVSTLQPGYCLIGESCIAAGAYQPGEFCGVCDPARDAYGWSIAPAGTACRGMSASCTDGEASWSSCDGISTSTCSVYASPCAPYGCVTDGVICATSCLDDGDCAAGARCDADGECRALAAQGADCVENADCQSGHCVGAICCDTECESWCDTCETGTCSPIDCSDGLDCTVDTCDPENQQCIHTLQSDSCLIGPTCVAAGVYRPGMPCELCDPAQNQYGWSLAPAGAVCNGAPPMSCANGQSTSILCVGTHSNVCAPSVTDCWPYRCAEDGATCAATCTTGDQCATGTSCIGGVCRLVECSDGSDCASGFCAGGICCTTACEGLCNSCETGVCVPKNCNDDRSCTGDSCDPETGACVHVPFPASCLIDEICFATGDRNPEHACEWCAPNQNRFDWTIAPQGIPCGPNPSVCADSVWTVTGCNGVSADICQTSNFFCAAYGCASATGPCRTSCANDSECASGARCAGGICRFPGGAGAVCSGSAHCLSGHCPGGFCCTTECACGVCTAATSGICTVAAMSNPAISISFEVAGDPLFCQPLVQLTGFAGCTSYTAQYVVRSALQTIWDNLPDVQLNTTDGTGASLTGVSTWARHEGADLEIRIGGVVSGWQPITC